MNEQWLDRDECTHEDERGSTVMLATPGRYECIVCAKRFRLVPEDARQNVAQGVEVAASPSDTRSVDGLPDGAYLSITGPTATPARRWAAVIMDHPSDYTSRTLSWGFSPDSIDEAAADAVRNLATYEQRTWPYRNTGIDRAIAAAALSTKEPGGSALYDDHQVRGVDVIDPRDGGRNEL